MSEIYKSPSFLQLLLIPLFGGPYLAMELVLGNNIVWSVLLMLVWLLLVCIWALYVADRGVLRKRFSFLLISIITGGYIAILYAAHS